MQNYNNNYNYNIASAHVVDTVRADRNWPRLDGVDTVGANKNRSRSRGNEMASAHMVNTADAAQSERKINNDRSCAYDARIKSGEAVMKLITAGQQKKVSFSQMLRSIKKIEDRQMIMMEQIMQMQETLNKNQKILQKVFLVYYTRTFFCIAKIK